MFPTLGFCNVCINLTLLLDLFPPVKIQLQKCSKIRELVGFICYFLSSEGWLGGVFCCLDFCLVWVFCFLFLILFFFRDRIILPS